MDPTYVQSDTPRSRRQMGAIRESPSLTRLRSRMHILQEVPEEDHEAWAPLSTRVCSKVCTTVSEVKQRIERGNEEREKRNVVEGYIN